MTTALDDLLIDGLAPLGAVAVRRMFGGAGVFVDGLMIGLVIDDVLFLKADAATQPRFEAEGLEAFRYQKRAGQVVVMSFWQAPERLLDDPHELAEWGREALGAARRAAGKAAKAAAARAGRERPGQARRSREAR